MKPRKPPRFWYDQSTPLLRLQTAFLRPFSWLWRVVSRVYALSARPYASSLPVLCVGNVTVGGAGKTPSSITILLTLRTAGLLKNPCFLTRGYGGTARAATLVKSDNNALYGDEAVLLSHYAPVIVAADRVEGLKLAERSNFDGVIADDGFQNPRFSKTASIVVFDGASGLGNGFCLPAGPCREPIEWAMARMSAAIIVGDDQLDLAKKLAGIPVFSARFIAAQPPKSVPYVAFAGIGRPEKFFKTLEDNHHLVVNTIAFPDHYAYQENDMRRLFRLAKRHDAQLITTEKDYVRLPADMREGIDVLQVALHIDAIENLVKVLAAKS